VGLHFVREGRELLVAAGKRIRHVDRDLALEPAHLPERVPDHAGRDRDEHRVGVRHVAAVLPQLLHLVSCLAPARGQAAADVSSTYDGDVHPVRNEGCSVTIP